MFVQREPHPESKAMLSLMSLPGLVETQSAKEIERIFTRDGYQKDRVCSITMGWGAFVDEPDAPTSTTIVSSDGKVLNIAVGPNGTYGISICIEDVNNPTAEDKEWVKDYVKNKAALEEMNPAILNCMSEGSKFIAFVERCKLDVI